MQLSNAVPAFEPTLEQREALALRVPGHELVSVATDDELFAALPLAEAAVVWRFPAEWYARAPRLRHLFTPSAGREPFDPEPSGRVTLHFGRFHGALMAESLLGMVLFMNRRFGEAVAAQAARRWDRSPYSSCRRLHGQLALIIGFGAIGGDCARLLSGLGMAVHGLRRRAALPSAPAERVFTPEQRLEALALADHVVCVLPGDTGTDHFLDAAAFAAMKQSAVVYNIGRGNAIDPDALTGALHAGRIAGAFLDVQADEPLPASSPLWTAPNLYLTPHASAISRDYLDLYFHELAAQLASMH
jgi:phosphoglycerate dehydrogenase-like enzyme